ncbi:maleylpyruvate isomerase N-terminal domain-containing protein [Actinocrispum wychmicini]|uniref:Uncharacterized protein (TIGR03083 family) n=1 Tax=Actinocrispum wychmicini TaxID=1213861 RepID=A0A4V6NP05_9PSEU|nr:maleylpyruvate isomerase N-terminal domain-containing protein [Actinocrispum wychmicini]TCO62020.1 uncharacterized protein (TIGR03083 family) [Actinocrispum wychmicini]
MTNDTGQQPLEAAEFLTALDSSLPNALTACPGRTVHTLAAHVTGTYYEITRHVDNYMAGTPLQRTRTFDEREPEFRVLSAPDLMRAFEEGERRMRASLAELFDKEPDPVLLWTKRQAHATSFIKHQRDECAVHRWDLVGGDEISEKLLSQEELFMHVVNFIGPLPMTARGIATGAGFGAPLQARIRATGQPDLLVTVNRGQPSIAAVEPAGEALIEGDPAARLLFMWGRRATPFGRLLCHGTAEELSRVQWLLSGY